VDEKNYRDIIDLLRGEQRGLTIEEISKKLNLSRITSTKYLNSLFVSGQLNMRKLGPAKLFTLSTRLPVDQILSQSSDLILILDESYIVRDISDSFLLAFGISNEHIKNQKIASTSLGTDLIDRIRNPVKKGMAGKESVINTWIPVQKEWKAFRIRIIPLVFGWADKGVVVMFEDRTGEIMAHEENALLADLVNASPAAITVHDLFGKILYSNKKNLDLHGYSLNEFINLNLNDLYTPGSAKRIDEHMKKLKETGEATFHVVHVKKDGQEIPLEVHAKIARWGEQDVIINIATDISERKRAEHALKESKRRLADIIDFLPDATFVVNNEGIVIAWNRAIEAMTGIKADDIVGKGNYEYALPFYHERRPITIDLVLHYDPAVAAKYPVMKKEGCALFSEIFIPHLNKGRGAYLWFMASPLYDAAGNFTGAIESIRDITERKRTEEALIESDSFNRRLIEILPDYIVIYEEGGNLLYVNPASTKALGYDAGTLVGTNILSYIAGEYHEIVTARLAARGKGDDRSLYEIEIVTKNGLRRSVLVKSTPIQYRNNPAVLTHLIDITERKQTK
jgi:PAS domain S-box-containing protein